MDARKLDLVFFISYQNGKILSFEEIQEIAKKYSARTLWKLWHRQQRSKLA